MVMGFLGWDLESLFLRGLIRIARVFGQFPARIHYAELIWIALVFIYNVICAQTLYCSLASLYITLPMKFTTKLGILLGIVRMVEMYANHVAWLLQVTKCNRVLDMLVAQQRPAWLPKCGLAQTVKSVAFRTLSFVTFFAFCGLNALTFQLNIVSPTPERELYLPYLRELQSHSWLMRWVGPEGVSWLVFAHVFLMTACEVISVSCVASIANQLAGQLERLARICDGETCQPSQVYECTIELRRAFIALQAAAGRPILVSMGMYMLTTTVHLFVVASLFYVSFNQIVGVVFLLKLGLAFLKQYLLASAGERLRVKADAFRFSVANLSPEAVPKAQHGALARLQRIVATCNGGLSFELSGCGYFKLNNQTLLSVSQSQLFKFMALFAYISNHFSDAQVLAAVVTYNVVIIQFQFTA